MKVNIDSLADAVTQELKAYSQDVTDGLKKAVRQVSKETAEELQATSPRRTGEYADDWISTVEYEDRSDIRAVVRNRGHYQLTHLLEDGHAKVNGGRVDGISHIGPAEEKAAKKLEGRVEVTIKG